MAATLRVLLWIWATVTTLAFTVVQQEARRQYRLNDLTNEIRFRSTRLFASTAATDTDSSVASLPSDVIGDVFFLISANEQTAQFGASSPTGQPTLREAVQHLAAKAQWWADGKLATKVVTVDDNCLDDLVKADVVIAMGLGKEEVAWAQRLFDARLEREPAQRHRQCQFAIDCAQELPSFVGPFDPVAPPLASRLPWTQAATARRLWAQMNDLFGRWTSDDFLYAVMIFLNQFSGSPVDWVKHSIDATWEKGPVRNARELYAMLTKCGNCIRNCVADDTCRECLGTLTAIDSRDQVASYKTIVSYESDLLREFSLCILTKNNIFGCDAAIPELPLVEPITTWRQRPLTEEIGRSILVGHLKDEASAPSGSLNLDVSWKVAAGANVAYDQFPSQNQLFYPAAKGRDMWYDPVFLVETLDGRTVWCKRHYKVRPATKPGTFRLSVLDNGVTSNEFWTIVGAADDLSWVVFHYAGAAAAVGQRYLGGLLCTPDGSMPKQSQLPKIWECFQSAGIQPWELYRVNNDDTSPGYKSAGPPPLDFYRAQVLAKRAQEAAAS